MSQSILVQFNVYRWAGMMPIDTARLGNLERVSGRLAERSLLRHMDNQSPYLLQGNA
jgi:hypothetical protein